MSFNFDELLQQGKGAADNVKRNKKEIRDVLVGLENSLSGFLNTPIQLKEYIEFVKDTTHTGLLSGIANPFQPKEKTGFNEVYIESEQTNVSKMVFKIKRSDNVYPVTVVRGQNHSIADNQSEFAAVIGQIASNPQFHLQLDSFSKQVEKELTETAQITPKSE